MMCMALAASVSRLGDGKRAGRERSWRGARGEGRMVSPGVVGSGTLGEPGEGEEAVLLTGEGGGGRGAIGGYRREWRRKSVS